MTRPAPAAADSPMGEVEWQIALSLADGPKHGYAVLLEIEERMGRGGRVLPGSLYRALHRLEREGLVAEVKRPVRGEDERRRTFTLTPAGRRAATAEARRLDAAIRVARERGLLPRRGEA